MSRPWVVRSGDQLSFVVDFPLFIEPATFFIKGSGKCEIDGNVVCIVGNENNEWTVTYANSPFVGGTGMIKNLTLAPEQRATYAFSHEALIVQGENAKFTATLEVTEKAKSPEGKYDMNATYKLEGKFETTQTVVFAPTT